MTVSTPSEVSESNPAMSAIEFYFDYLSPYAYIAWTQLPKLARRYGRAVRPVPVLFAALLSANGTKGPAEIPRKREYVFRDAWRHCHALGLPFVPPPAHPFHPLLALRATTIAKSEAQPLLISALFAASWGGQRLAIDDARVIANVADSIGIPGVDLLAAANTDEAKGLLRTHTEEALARGAFGVPSMYVDGELFWGFDSFNHIERRLQGRDPVEGASLEEWRNLPSTATRPQT